MKQQTLTGFERYGHLCLHTRFFRPSLALQTALMTDPEAGPIIPGSGGVRKLRWAAPGRGKIRNEVEDG